MQVSPKLLEALDLDRASRRVLRDSATDFISPSLEYLAVKDDPAPVIDRLASAISSAEYHPRPLRRIEVPKPDFTLRPGTVPDIADRILYQALVDHIADQIDDKLLRPPVVFGYELETDGEADDGFVNPRGYDSFRERLQELFDSGRQFVLMTDITAYFACIDPAKLGNTLDGFGVDGTVVAAIRELLGYWNRWTPTGLPQGVWPSDYLGARVYLDRVDKQMRALGYEYFRFSDDIRIVGGSMREIRAALQDLIIQLRSQGLHVQSAKTNLLDPDDAQAYLDRLHARIERARGETLSELLELEPYSYTSPEEALRELSEDEILQSEPLLEALLEAAYADGTNPDFEMCRTALAGYRRIRSTSAVPIALALLSRLPALTHEIFRYIRTVIDDEVAPEVRRVSMRVLLSDDTIYSWQKHWVLRMLHLNQVRQLLRTEDIRRVARLAIDKNEHPSVRSRAIMTIGVVGEDSQVLQLKEAYSAETDPDVRHAILLCCRRLTVPERKTFYRLCQGQDPMTDRILALLTKAQRISL